MYQFEIWRNFHGRNDRIKWTEKKNTENYQVFLKNTKSTRPGTERAVSCIFYAKPAMIIELWLEWSFQYPELWPKKEHFTILTVHLWDESIYCHGWDGSEPTCKNNQIILHDTDVSETTCSGVLRGGFKPPPPKILKALQNLAKQPDCENC